MQEKTILVMVAMEVEAKYLLEKFDKLEKKVKRGFTLYEGKISDTKIIILLSGVGTINASSSLMMAIMEYKPDVIVNYGTAGAMTKDIHTKDIVIAQKVVNINSYRTSNLKEGEGTRPEYWELLTFIAGETDRYIEEEANTDLLELTKKLAYTNGNINYGKVGSGDMWNNEIDRMIYFNQKYNIIAEDMESIALYTIANKQNIPVISIKIISDNRLLGEEYNREVGLYIQDYIYKYLELINQKLISKKN